MYRYSQENILLGSKAIKLLSNTKILLVGGGRASEIKVKTLCQRDFPITVVAPSFSERIVELAENFENILLKQREFRASDIESAHLVIVGTDNHDLNGEIARLCRRRNKLYAYLPDFKLGNLSFLYERETVETGYSISTKRASPMTARYLGEKIARLLEGYDDFVSYVCDIRESIDDSELKSQIMAFVNTDEFYEFYAGGYGDLILKTFYGGGIFEQDSGD